MSDEPTPELRELAARLFAAGRDERPSAALGRRLLMIVPAQAAARDAAPVAQSAGPHPLAPPGSGTRRAEGRVEGRRRVEGWRRAAWLGAAAFAAAGVCAWWRLGAVPAIEAIAMSPERASHPPAVAATRQAPPSPSDAVSRAVGTAPPPPAALPARATAEHAEAAAESVERGARALELNGTPALRRRTASRGQPASRAQAAPRSTPVSAAASREASRPEASSIEASPIEASSIEASSSQTPAPAAEPAAPLALADELAGLKAARTALRAGQPMHALELLDRQGHARATESLHAEATLLRIEALDALGRHAEASQLAARFLRDDPHSPLGDRAKSFIRPSNDGR